LPAVPFDDGDDGMASRAQGAFDVGVGAPVPLDSSDPASLATMSLDKTFHGPLAATARGTMLTGSTEANGSRVYVALDRVTGTLDGRRGSFLLAHYGTMSPEGFQLSVTVVPASGTDELKGLAGTLAITVAEKKHSYDFEYTLPA
jgi:hypothetical protein